MVKVFTFLLLTALASSAQLGTFRDIASYKRLAGGADTPASYPLDNGLPTASSAWSVAEALTDAYNGNLIRVRESGGDTEADIGQNADGTLDETALLAHVGAADGFIVTIYDQIGVRHVARATSGEQPKIVSAGVVVTDSGGRVSALYDGSNDSLGYSGFLGSYPFTVASAAVVVSNGTFGMTFGYGPGTDNVYYYVGVATNVANMNARNTTSLPIYGTTDLIDGARHVITGQWRSNTDRELFQGATSEATSATSVPLYTASPVIFIGRRTSSALSPFWFSGYISDVILWADTLDSSEMSILANYFE